MSYVFDYLSSYFVFPLAFIMKVMFSILWYVLYKKGNYIAGVGLSEEEAEKQMKRDRREMLLDRPVFWGLGVVLSLLKYLTGDFIFFYILAVIWFGGFLLKFIKFVIKLYRKKHK